MTTFDSKLSQFKRKFFLLKGFIIKKTKGEGQIRVTNGKATHKVDCSILRNEDVLDGLSA